jgi:prevent-host-death family protein
MPQQEIEHKRVKVVIVTSSVKSAGRKRKKPAAESSARTGYWVFNEAKARLSEVVRRARSEGPQHVTIHGRDGVVVVAEEEFRRLKGDVTGAALVEAMQASPSREVELEPERARMPVRDIDLS